MAEQIKGDILQKIIISIGWDQIKEILDTIPAGVSIVAGAACEEIIHNAKAAEFLRIKPWENFVHWPGEKQPVRMFSNEKELTAAELPLYRSALKGEVIAGFEVECVWEDGVRKFVLWNASPLVDENGSITGAVGSFKDITGRKLAEEALRRGEERLRALITASSDAVYHISPDWSEMYHLQRRGFIPDTCSPDNSWIHRYIHFEDRPRLEAAINEAIRTKSHFELEHRVLCLDGTVGWVLSRAVPILDARGEISEWFGTAKDITQRKGTEKILRQAKRQLDELCYERTRKLEEAKKRVGNKMLKGIADAFYDLDNKYRFTYISQDIEEIWNCKRRDLQGRDIREVLPKSIGGPMYTHFQRVMLNKEPSHFTTKSAYTGRWTEVDVYPMQEGISVYFRDITNRKRIEEKLQEARQEIMDILESISDVFCALDSKMQFTYVNRSGEELLGFSREQLMGREAAEIFPNAWYDNLQMCRQVMADGRPCAFECLSPASQKWFSARVYPYKNGISIYLLDITEHKQAEEKLQKSEARCRQIVAASSDGFWWTDSQLTITGASESMGRLLGYPVEELVGRWGMDFVDRGWVYRALQGWEKRKLGKQTRYDFKMKRKDGVSIWVRHSSSPVLDEQGRFAGSLSAFTDITESKKAEEDLRQSEECFYKIFHNSPAMIVLEREDNNCFVEANQAFLDASGYSREEIIGQTSKEINIWINDQKKAPVAGSPYYGGNLKNCEVNFRTKTGKIITVLASVELININGQECRLTLMKDITDKKKTEAEIARLDYLNLVGEMAVGIGHEIRNPMTTVRGFLQLFGEKERYAQDRKHLDLMIEELDAANAIISKFLVLAKNKAVKLEMKNLNKILKCLYPLIQADALVTDNYITLKTRKIPDLLLDEKETKQLILNLVCNGLEAMEPGKTLTIETFMAEDNVVLAVKDQGSGIPEEIIDKVGIPFFTTKDSGTGLGLAVCYSIAARHKAVIDIEAGPGGATFFVRFKTGTIV